MPLYTYKLTIEYDGTLYHGWQKQPHQSTIQAAIEKALLLITGEAVSIVGAGRTDAGVHALAQVAHFHLTRSKEPHKLLAGINALLPQDISIRKLERVDSSFHARFGATRKTYCYFLDNGPTRSPHLRHTAWHIKTPINMSHMRRAASYLIGKRDFSSLIAADHDAKSRILDLQEVRITKKKEQIVFTLVASRFLKYMVRNIVGLLVEVGTGRRRPSEMIPILEAMDRRCAGRTAPAHGLFLMKVDYDNDTPPVTGV